MLNTYNLRAYKTSQNAKNKTEKTQNNPKYLIKLNCSQIFRYVEKSMYYVHVFYKIRNDNRVGIFFFCFNFI